MIESDPVGYIGAVLAMGLAAYLTRIGGYWLIGRFPIGKRVHRMLNAMPGAVITASVLPILAKDGLAAGLAVMVAALTMMAVRNDFAAVIAGVAAAALVRAAGL